MKVQLGMVQGSLRGFPHNLEKVPGHLAKEDDDK